MEEENKYGKMEMYMKGIGKMIKSTNLIKIHSKNIIK